MKTQNPWRVLLVGLLLIVSMAAAACGQQQAPAAAQPAQPQVAAPVQPQAAVRPAFDVKVSMDKFLTDLPADFNTIAPIQAKEQIDTAKPFVLDVRDAKDVAGSGFIPGAVNIPIRTLAKNLDKLPADKNAPIIAYCAIGHNGAITVTVLNQLGYTNVKSVVGGWEAWKAANLSVATGGPVAPTAGKAADVDKDMLAAVDKFLTDLPADFNTIGPVQAKEQIDTAKPFVLDVRDAKDVADNGKLPGAVNIPIRTLAKNLDKLPADKSTPIITYCPIGHNGAATMEMLSLLGYTNVKSVVGGFDGWTKANLPVQKN